MNRSASRFVASAVTRREKPRAGLALAPLALRVALAAALASGMANAAPAGDGARPVVLWAVSAAAPLTPQTEAQAGEAQNIGRPPAEPGNLQPRLESALPSYLPRIDV